jgi:hypothetical protein
MADTAAHLVDRVLPRAPVRQWVLTFPREVKWHLARDSALLSGAISIFMDEVFRYLKRRYVMRKRGVTGEGEASAWRWRRRLPADANGAECGGVTAIQRYGSSLNCHPHLHSLVLDGVYVEEKASGKLAFVRLPGPEDEDLRQILLRGIQRLRKFLKKRGCLLGDETSEGVELEVLDEIQAGSIQELVSMELPVRRTIVVGKGDAAAVSPKPFCVDQDGYTLHAGVRIGGNDRDAVEKIAKYLLRPAFAQERLSLLPDGRVAYDLRRPRWDGGTRVIMTPIEFLSKLAALVPAPRSHLLRYHGALGPNFKRRSEIVPPAPPGERVRESAGDAPGCRHPEGSDEDVPKDGGCPRRRRATDWATLLRRSIGVDVLDCPRCHGRMRVLAFITHRPVIRKILFAMGLSSEIPVRAPPRDPPQREFVFDQ